jgi:hypothetical protein
MFSCYCILQAIDDKLTPADPRDIETALALA